MGSFTLHESPLQNSNWIWRPDLKDTNAWSKKVIWHYLLLVSPVWKEHAQITRAFYYDSKVRWTVMANWGFTSLILYLTTLNKTLYFFPFIYHLWGIFGWRGAWARILCIGGNDAVIGFKSYWSCLMEWTSLMTWGKDYVELGF